MLRTSKRGLKAFLKFIIIIFASIRNGFLTCYLVTWYRVSEWLRLTIYVVTEVRTCQYTGCKINMLLAIKSQLGWVILLFNFKGLISCKKGFRVIRAWTTYTHPLRRDETVVPAGYVRTILQDDNNEETLRKKSGLLNLLYRTLYSLFVFQLAKRLQLTVDTYKLVSYLSQIND